MARFVAAVTAGLTVLAALAALLALGALAGRLVPWLDVLSHLAPLYAVAGAGGLAWGLLGRRRRLRLVSVLAIVATGLLVAPEFARDTGPVAAANAPGQITVIQLNSQRSNADIERVAGWLIEQDADFVLITESRHDLRDLLSRRTGWKVSGSRGSQMIFTRDRRLVMNRPPARHGPLNFVNATYASESGPLEVVTTHIDWPIRPAARAQAAMLERVIAQMPRERMVLAGDFNAAPWSARIRRLDRSLGLVRRGRAIPTWPAQVLGRPWPLPFLPIDHVYAGPGWATVKVERGPWLGSDHYPLVVTLAPVSPR